MLPPASAKSKDYKHSNMHGTCTQRRRDNHESTRSRDGHLSAEVIDKPGVEQSPEETSGVEKGVHGSLNMSCIWICSCQIHVFLKGSLSCFCLSANYLTMSSN